MTDDQRENANAILREHLVTGTLGTHTDRIEAYRVELPPGQKAGSHFHPGGVAGYVLDGEITFEIEGQPPKLLRRGSAFFEPPAVTILRFDNASDIAPAVFLAFYPLNGDQALIEMSDG